MAPVIWLILGLVLVATELLVGEFTLLMLGGGALAAAGVSLVFDDLVVGGVVFALASVLLLFAVRPVLLRRSERSLGPSTMHSKAHIGGPALVIARVDGHGGRVKIGGDVWSARTYGDDVIEPGEKVTVVEISGATAMVVARH